MIILQKQLLLKHPLKNVWRLFFRSDWLTKWLHYRSFSGSFTAISEQSNETFSLESVLAEVRNLGLQSCSVGKKTTVSQRFFWNCWYFRKYCPFWAPRNVSVVQRELKGSKANSTTYVFLTILQKFWCSYFKTSSWNHLWRSSVEFYAADYSPVLY